VALQFLIQQHSFPHPSQGDNTYSVDQPTRCESDMPLQQTKATKYPK